MRTKAEWPLWPVIKVQTHGKSEITMKTNQPHTAQIYQMKSKVMIENDDKIISDSLSSSFQPNIFSSFPSLPHSPASQLKCSCIVCEFVETMESESVIPGYSPTRGSGVPHSEWRWIKDQHAARHLSDGESDTCTHSSSEVLSEVLVTEQLRFIKSTFLIPHTLYRPFHSPPHNTHTHTHTHTQRNDCVC